MGCLFLIPIPQIKIPILVDNTFQQSQHITDFINLNRTSSGRYDAGLVAGQFHSSSGTLANQCAEVDASSTNETDNNGNKSISESKVQ